MNIVHIAWLGNGNYGDDLMAEAVREQVDARTGTLNEWTIWCDQIPSVLPAHARWIYNQGLVPLPRSLLEKRALNKADLLLIGGGSVLHSYNSCEWKRRGASIFHQKGKQKAFGIGLGIGPFDTKQDEDACVAFLKELDGCAFRDHASYTFARSCQLSYEPVLAFDLAACVVGGKEAPPVAASFDHIGVSVRIPYRVDVAETTAAYVELLEQLTATYRKVTVFSFSYNAENSELNYCKQLQSQMRSGEISIVPYDGDTAAFTKKLSACDFHITTKYHGAIISYLFGIPFTMISYQRKFEDLADDIHLPLTQRFTQQSIDVQKILKSIRSFELPGRKDLREKALRNFDVLT